MGKFIDLTGKTFGNLTVIGFAERRGKNYYWRCRCSCGNFKVINTSGLLNGSTLSCGCLNRTKHFKHGLEGTKTYNTWLNIKQRCLNPNCKAYPNYGGRGITICDSWKDNFENFYNYVSALPHFGEVGYTLDRIDNDGNYEPDNVKWSTKTEQARNKSNNVIVEYDGELMTLGAAAEKSGLNYKLLHNRYRHGKRGNDLFKPVKK